MSIIFISYRRDDSAPYAGRLYDRLAAQFGAAQVFMDIDQIEPGEDFVEVIQRKVGACETAVVLIGKAWLGIADATGRRRLDDPEDFVRLEVAAALERGVRVVPVLVGGASMPRAEQLPAVLAPLSRRNAVEISDSRFHRDVDRLVQALARPPAAPASAPAPSPAPAPSRSHTPETPPGPATPASGPGRNTARVEPAAGAGLLRSLVGTPPVTAGVATVAVFTLAWAGWLALKPTPAVTGPGEATTVAAEAAPQPAVVAPPADAAPAGDRVEAPVSTPVSTPLGRPVAAPAGAMPNAIASLLAPPKAVDIATAQAELRERAARAAAGGTAQAQFEYATLLECGGDDKRPDEALRWYRRAAEQGHAPAREAVVMLSVPAPADARQTELRAAQRDTKCLSEMQKHLSQTLNELDGQARAAIRHIKPAD